MINQQIRYFDTDGRPTIEGLKLFQGIERRLRASDDRLAAIAAVSPPAGGAVVDDEARSAVEAMISGAAG